MIRTLLPIFLTLFVLVAEGQIVINEVCSRNSDSFEDESGSDPDWIELFNAGAQPIDLSIFHLSDRNDDPQKWQLPPIVIQPGGHVILLSGDEDGYFNFGISGDGESILLSQNSIVIDQLDVPELHTDHSFGRTPDGLRVFDQPTPGSANTTTAYLGYAEAPILSPPPGLYNSAMNILLTGGTGSTIHFSVDGRDPSISGQIYSSPIQIQQSRVVQAFATAPEKLPSSPIGGSYLIGIDHDLPVISISVDPDSMFHEELGIYMPGPDADTVPPYWGANFWEGKHIPAWFEFHEKGARRIAQKIDLRIQGGSSARPKPQKPLRLTARKKYGAPRFEYPVFPERNAAQEHKQLVLRNSGGDFCLANFRDGLFHQIALHNGLDIDVLAFRPTVVYINGAYWGMMHLRERIRTDRLTQGFDVDEDEVILLDGENDIVQGDTMPFFELMEYIRINDMNDPIHFAHVDSLLDLKSFVDYFSLEMFAGNVDWPANNIRYYKPSLTQGKWRYLLHDLDATMNVAGYIPMDIDMFHLVFVLREGFVHSEVFQGLLINDEFKRGFVNRLADLMNTAFSQPSFQHEVDLITGAIRSEIEDHFARWDCWFPVWELHAHGLIPEFARDRAGFMREDMIDHFVFAGASDLRFEVFPPEGGSMRINTITPEMPFNGVYFNGNEIDLSIEVASGHQFDHWEYSAEEDFIDRSIHLRRNFPASGKITAVLRHEGEGITMWPNPVRDHLTASFNSAGEQAAMITVNDARGRQLVEEARALRDGTNRVELDLQDLPAGMYMISVTSGSDRRSARFLKIGTDL